MSTRYFEPLWIDAVWMDSCWFSRIDETLGARALEMYDWALKGIIIMQLYKAYHNLFFSTFEICGISSFLHHTSCQHLNKAAFYLNKK